MKSFNDVLQKEVEHNLNNLYDGAFQSDIKQVKTCLEIVGNRNLSFEFNEIYDMNYILKLVVKLKHDTRW